MNRSVRRRRSGVDDFLAAQAALLGHVAADESGAPAVVAVTGDEPPLGRRAFGM
ncbi:hypothetical protein [Nocardia alni]|uniref:hypothetical protein n=1 Tax=Nocardia alni TaxID=2815723 RepID=UPI001C23AF54|nr:hypothetical protein [Nocardia alni]